MKFSELSYRTFTVTALLSGEEYIDLSQPMLEPRVNRIYRWMFGAEPPDASTEDLQLRLILRINAKIREFDRWTNERLILEVKANQLTNRPIDN